MATEYGIGRVGGYGHGNLIAACRFVPGATPTVSESWGVRTVARNGGAGLYRITLADKHPGFVALVQEVENDTTLYHVLRVETYSVANSTIDISHKSVAFADVATGPAASDSVDEIIVLVYARGQ
jgi:hypothetical protein